MLTFAAVKVFFIHSQDTDAILRMHGEGTYPSHLLYGAIELPSEGVETLIDRHASAGALGRWRFSLRMAWRVLACREPFDAVYGTSFNGLEILILLRAFGLFRKPIVLWHHQPAQTSSSWLRERLARRFYKGIDRMFFFSQHILNESLRCGKVIREQAQVVDWGYDLSWRALPMADGQGTTFISTGKERRDMPTLIKAAERAGAEVDIYLPRGNGQTDYEAVLGGIAVPESVHLHWSQGLLYGKLAQTVAQARCVCICCLPSNYTVGLTTLMEALALGLPVITTENPAFPFDVEVEGVGLSVASGDIEGWAKAMKWMMTHSEEAHQKGLRGRALAERRFNIQHTARQVAESLRQVYEQTH